MCLCNSSLTEGVHTTGQKRGCSTFAVEAGTGSKQCHQLPPHSESYISIKVFENVGVQQTVLYLEESSLMPRLQSSGRYRRLFTERVLLKLIMELCDNSRFYSGHVTLLVLLDLIAAFDTIDLIKRLSGRHLDFLIKSFLDERMMTMVTMGSDLINSAA